MLKLRYMVGLVTVLLGLGVPPVGAAPRGGLARFFLVTNTYSDWSVRLDGREILRASTGTLSDYVAVPDQRGHTLEIYGYGLGIGGEKLLGRYHDYHVRPAAKGLDVYTDDGARL